jgi:hypothetical protein
MRVQRIVAMAVLVVGSATEFHARYFIPRTIVSAQQSTASLIQRAALRHFLLNRAILQHLIRSTSG